MTISILAPALWTFTLGAPLPTVDDPVANVEAAETPGGEAPSGAEEATPAAEAANNGDDEVVLDDAPGAPPPDSPAPPAEADPPAQPAPELRPSAPAPTNTDGPQGSYAAGIDLDRFIAEGQDERSRQSPQHFAFEFKLGPYLPAVDDSYQGDGFGPYTTIFGKTDERGEATEAPKSGVLLAGAFEWQFINLAGPLGIGLQAGFFRDKADAIVADAPADAETIRSEADKNTFSVVPMALQLVYRLELFADRYHVPLVPYAKAGMGYALWWARDGNKNLSRNNSGQKAIGGSFGYQINAGAMLRLDFLEPGEAKSMDSFTGVNHSYLFGEYQISQLDGFGNGKNMNVGANTWLAGLAIEF